VLWPRAQKCVNLALETGFFVIRISIFNYVRLAKQEGIISAPGVPAAKDWKCVASDQPSVNGKD
jgi:hypothetical protein